nr:type II secretion system secretin GspD [Dechloromonas sp.]
MNGSKKTHSWKRSGHALAFALALSHALLAGAESTAGEPVSLNFVNADIGAVIQAISRISGRNFVVDPRVKGTINIVTTTPVPPAMSYSILSSALRLQGYAVVESKGVTQVVPEADAKLHAGPVVGKGRRETEDNRLVTQVFMLKHESAAQVVPVIRPLVAPNNTVAAYPGNNSVVVTDYAENVRRIGQIIESIDVPQDGVRVFPLSHASAIDIAATINRLMNEGGGTQDASQRVSIVADNRSNSLLVRSDNLSRIAAVRQLVTSLDAPGALGNIHVVYLKNAEAVKVAQTLRAVLSGDSSALPTGGTSTPFSGAPTGSTAPMSAPPQPSASAGTGQQANGSGMIQADAMTNSLIITAPEPIYNNLRRAIDQLDRRRAQVYVEALITEISAETAAEYGIQWQAGKLSNSNSAAAGTNFGIGGANIQNVASGAASPASGLNLILGGGTVSVLGKEILDLNMLARLLRTDTRANILSTPNLITLDNEEAKMVVGQNLPFVTGQYTNTGAVSTVTNPFQTIERKDVGLTLKVKPQISESGTVRLQIYQEASSVVGTSTANANGPTTNKRSIESTVLVDDGAIIALGGLIEDSYNAGSERVPFLGDIPYVGALFRYDSRKRSKTNLIVFLRPVILRDGASAQGIADARYDYIIGQQRQTDRPQALMRGEAPFPELPPRDTPPPALPYYLPAGAEAPVSDVTLRKSDRLWQ